MSGKTGGYVTDTAYVAEFYGDHAPTHMNLVAAANGFGTRPLGGDFAWCDYGCGNGITAAVLAGCARLFLNMVDLAVPKDLQEEFRNVGSRAELEAKRDFIRNEAFCRDVWVKGEPLGSEDEWLKVNQELVFGTLEPLANIDRAVAFGDLQLSYQNEPFAGLLKAVASRALSVRTMEDLPNMGGLSPWTRAEAARLLAAGGQVMAFAGPTTAVNRGIVKELGRVLPRLALAAPAAGTGVEMTNIDAVLPLARCEHGGDVVIGGKKLTSHEVEKLLKDRLAVLEVTMLDKLVEIGVLALGA